MWGKAKPPVPMGGAWALLLDGSAAGAAFDPTSCPAPVNTCRTPAKGLIPEFMAPSCLQRMSGCAEPPVRTEVCCSPLLGLAEEGKEGNLGDKWNKNALWVNCRNPM